MAIQELKTSQYRSLQSLAVVIEEKLQEMEALLCLSALLVEDDRLLKIKDSLTLQEKEIFIKKLDALRRNTVRFAAAYGLKATKSSLKKTLTIKAAFLWEEISGATFDRLKGYGEIDEAMRNEYENHINSLTDLTSDLMQISSNHEDN